MSNLKEIRNRITSVSSTMQITSAMKMVSAAKLKRAQDAITAIRPYAEKLTKLLQNVTVNSDEKSVFKYINQPEMNKILLVVITSNRGLCGAFNVNVIKEVKKIKQSLYPGKQVDFVTIGKKGNDVISKTDKVIINDNHIYDDLRFDNVALIAEKIIRLFFEGSYDKIELVYNRFKNAATQVVVTETFLPIVKEEKTNEVDYIFEPSKERILEELIPRSLKIKLYKAVRDSFASEHGARMTAMHKATDNATELRDRLRLTYNKVRQASITNEILEIVGGAEALNASN